MDRSIRLPALVLMALVVAGCQPRTTERLAFRDPSALGPYSSAIISGDFCFVSGKIGERGGAFEHEVTTALDAVERALGDAGLTLADVVSVTVYLIDLDRYGEFNAIYEARLSAPYPARACVEVAALPGDARVEVQAIARRR